MKNVDYILTDNLYHFLKKPQVASVATVDAELNPVVSCISWLYAKDERTILFAIDSRSKTIDNIELNGKACIHIMTDQSVYSINGKATIKVNPMENLPFKMACVQVTIDEIRDVMFYGSTILQLPQLKLTYDSKVAKNLENQVYSQLKEI